MAEPTRVSSVEPDTYQPLSGLALAGFGAAVLFTVLLVVGTIDAFRSGAPLVSSFLLVLAVAAVLLCLAGRWHIRRSEGTRAGVALTRWGLGLSIVLGLGYGAFLVAKEVAIRNDARAIGDQWFEHLKKGKIYHAFYLALNPVQRLSDNPQDEDRMRIRYEWGEGNRPGPLVNFRDHELVRAVRNAGAAAEYRYTGVSKWEHRGGPEGGYQVTMNYQVSTPECNYQVELVVMGIESPKDFDGWRWGVLMDREKTGIRDKRYTPLGQALQALQISSARFADDWMKALGQGRTLEAFLDTLDLTERAEVRKRLLVGPTLLAGFSPVPGGHAVAAVAGWGFLGAHPEVRDLYLAGHRDFVEGKLVNDKDMYGPTPAKQKEVLRDVRAAFGPTRSVTLTPPQGPEARGTFKWALVGDELQVDQSMVVDKPPAYSCLGSLTVGTRDPQIIRLFRAWKEKGPEHIPDDPDALITLGRFSPSKWRVISLNLGTVTGARQKPG